VKIETTRFGTVEVPEDRVITMSQGLLGFPEKKRFCIIQHKKDSPFFWFQSVEEPALAFVITNPWLFKPDYKVDLALVNQNTGWENDDEDVSSECYVLVTIPKGSPEKMTANLIGPVIINNKTREAVQIVLSDESYSHKYPLVNKEAAA
jgi:flagellar assembly factor FliW